MDSVFSKHMTERIEDFLSFKAREGGWVSFGDGKKRLILDIGTIGKNLNHAIKNVHYVDGLKYTLLSVSQICDKRNKVKFMSNKCTITSIKNGEIIHTTWRSKNMHVAN